MPRLIALDFQVGIRLRIRTYTYTIVAAPLGSPEISILADGGDHLMTVTRSELATLLVKEEAEFVDDNERPPDASRCASRSVTEISRLSMRRMLDWHAKMFLLNRMRRHPCSPKSPVFRLELEKAQSDLDLFYSLCGFISLKRWSVWTLYHDLLRWRSQGFELAAFQRKGVEYTPHTGPSRYAFELLKAEVFATVKENPHLGPTAIARLHSKAQQAAKGARK
jgi:hypothetical protein